MLERLKQLEAKKRSELESALEKGQVHDPISILVSIGISALVSGVSFLVSRAFAPKPQKAQFGKLQGSLQLQNSEQGIMIPEIYGAGPAANLVAGASPTYQNLTNTTGGANGSITKTSGANNTYNAGASHNVAVTAGQDAFIKVIRGTGFAAAGFFTTDTPTGSGEDTVGMIFGVAWHNAGPFYTEINGNGEPQGNTVAGDEFTIELRAGRFRLFKNAAEITSFHLPVPAPTYPLYFGVIMYTSGAGVSNAKVQINGIGDPPNYARGGIKVPAIIDWSSGIRKHVSVTEQAVGGGKGFGGGGGGQTQTVENITYDIDLGLTFAHQGPYNFSRLYANADVILDQTDTSLLVTGAYDPTVGADPVYDPEFPPDPTVDFVLPINRQNQPLAVDGDGVKTGTVLGGATGFAVYAGTATQDPDPTEEADVDAKYGAGSTTAHRGKARVVVTNFDLSRWGGIVPNMNAVWEHQTLTDLEDIYASLCERVNVKTANGDYDFTGLATIKPRGMLIAGRLFSPAEVIGSPEIQTVYNYFVTEVEGQIKGYIEGTEPTVTIADTEIGWMDSDADVSDILPEVETIIANETSLARQVDVKYIDLDREWEPNTQSDNRQITEGVTTELMEVQLALLADEARTAAQRKLYRDYVGGSVHKFTLPWTYLYLHTGYKVTITRLEGFSHVLKLTSISGGIGVLACEGIAIEPAAYTQPAVGSILLGNPPIQRIPAMTVLTLLDTPLLRDADETNNNGVGFYAVGTPRTGVGQSWTGYALYRSRNNVWGLIGSSDLPGTIGVIVSVTGISTIGPSSWDRAGVIVVDLYGTEAALTSVTEQDVLANATVNLALFGNMVGQFVTATQVSGFPNRWSLSILLNGERGTETHIFTTIAGQRFVLINAAVVFVPAFITDINGLFTYRAVTSGQSLGDAATVEFVWTGEALRPLSPAYLRGTRDAAGNLLIEWVRRSRLASGLVDGSDVPLGEEQEVYDVDIMDGSTVERTITVRGGGTDPAVLQGLVRPDLISSNNLTGDVTTGAKALVVHALGIDSFVEASFVLTGTNAAVIMTIADMPNIDYMVSGGPPVFGLPFFSNVFFHDIFPDYATTLLEVADTAPPSTGYTSPSLGNVKTMRVRATLSETGVKYYWDYTGEGSVPFYVARTVPQLPSYCMFEVGGPSEVRNIQVGKTFHPSTVYTAEQQISDFSSVQGAIRVRVSQISAIVGRGPYIEMIL